MRSPVFLAVLAAAICSVGSRIEAQPQVDRDKLLATLKLPTSSIELRVSVNLDDIDVDAPADPEQYLAAARQKVAKRPDDPQAHLALADELRRRGEAEEAKAAYERAADLLMPQAKSEPGNWPLIGDYGRALLGAGRTQSALDYLTDATERRPDLWRAQERLASAALEGLMKAALVGDEQTVALCFQRAQYVGQRAAEASPEEPGALILRAKTAMVLLAFARTPRDDQALQQILNGVLSDLRAAANLAPDNVDLALTAAAADLALDQRQASIDPFGPTWDHLSPEQRETVRDVERRLRAIVADHPDQMPAARSALVLSLLLQDRDEDAGLLLTEAAAHSDDDNSALLDRAAFLAHIGAWDDALQSAHDALARKETGQAHCTIGYVHAGQGQYGEALEPYRKAREVDKERSSESLAGEAICLLRSGESPDTVVRLAQQAVSLGAPAPDLHLLLGVAHALAGNLDFARMHIRTAIAADGDEPRYQVALALLMPE